MGGRSSMRTTARGEIVVAEEIRATRTGVHARPPRRPALVLGGSTPRPAQARYPRRGAPYATLGRWTSRSSNHDGQDLRRSATGLAASPDRGVLAGRWASWPRPCVRATERDQREELGDVLAWLTSLADQLGLSLADACVALCHRGARAAELSLPLPVNGPASGGRCRGGTTQGENHATRTFCGDRDGAKCSLAGRGPRQGSDRRTIEG